MTTPTPLPAWAYAADDRKKVWVFAHELEALYNEVLMLRSLARPSEGANKHEPISFKMVRAIGLEIGRVDTVAARFGVTSEVVRNCRNVVKLVQSGYRFDDRLGYWVRPS